MQALLRRFGGLVVALLAAALYLSLVVPGTADEASDHAALDRLFAQLKAAPDAQSAQAIDMQIWQIWLNPPDQALRTRMQAVIASEQAGDLAATKTLLDKLVADYPSYAEGWNQRATVEYQLQQFDASLADIDKVLALEPRHFGALSGRVLIYLAENNRPLALKAMLAAMAIHPFLSEQQLFPELSQPQVQA